METNSDYQSFRCAYSQCRRKTTGFVFRDEKDNKFCSSFCRRKFTEEKKADIQASEDGSQDTVSWPPGPT